MKRVDGLHLCSCTAADDRKNRYGRAKVKGDAR